ncbi:MAG: hypothetical protein HGA80_02065, partial [Candidatus Omnitrophica bacterium]|nr:hypothetical protein [Candidatus Omnitrophota bacterium]
MALSGLDEPSLLMGVKLSERSPFHFDFIFDKGGGAGLSEDIAARQIKYFLTVLTVPGQDLWVNLSPAEQDRIMPRALSETDMGRDMLFADYILKQLAASISYPEESLGRVFWGEVYQKLVGKFGRVNVDMSSLNKVWVVPGEAEVYVNGNTAFITGARLKLMLANDYAAAGLTGDLGGSDKASPQSLAAESAAREILIPVLEKEVNEGKAFSHLRQIYHALLLALWARKHLSDPLWQKQYIGMGRIGGIDLDDKQLREKVYGRYLESFKQGVYNYIREQEDPVTHDMTPQKYFSGGFDFAQLDSADERNDKEARNKAAARMGALQSQGRLMAVASAVSPARNGQAKSAPT